LAVQLFTFGYEGAEPAAFLDVLESNKIELLLDIRELPLSRRKGFSKSALRASLEARGIEYRHERRLGTPKVLRDRVRADRDYATFFRDFGIHLAMQEQLLDELAGELNGNVVLLCYEKDHRTCHRALVAAALAERTGASVIHL
jgi:uncharacterized protein (DUF488 family)